MPQLEGLFMFDQILLVSVSVWLTYNIVSTIGRKLYNSNFKLVKILSVSGRGKYYELTV